MDIKSQLIKKYNIQHYNIKDDHLKYYYTKYPELCCTYDLKEINNSEDTVKPFEFKKALSIISNYYKNIKTSYYKNLLDMCDKHENISDMPTDIADSIVYEFIKFRKNTSCLTVWPYFDADIQLLKKYLQQFGHVYYIKKIKLNYQGALGLIHQLYSDTYRFPTVDKLKKKLEFLNWLPDSVNKIYVIFFENTSGDKLSGSQAPLKTKIRDYMLSLVSNKSLRGDDLVHINDFFYQTIEYAKIYLHNNSLKFLAKQNVENHMSDKFALSRLYLNTIKKWMIDNVKLIDQDRFLLMGSVILYVYGLRNCRDIDGMMYYFSEDIPFSDNLVENVGRFFCEKNTKFFYASIPITNTKYWNNDWDVNDLPWYKKMGINHVDEMIFDKKYYFYFNGIKFLRLKHELQRKILRNKPQDYADLLAANHFLKIKMRFPQLNDSDRDAVIKTLKEKYFLSEKEINDIGFKF